jgi:hypothetical protein
MPNNGFFTSKLHQVRIHHVTSPHHVLHFRSARALATPLTTLHSPLDCTPSALPGSPVRMHTSRDRCKMLGPRCVARRHRGIGHGPHVVCPLTISAYAVSRLAIASRADRRHRHRAARPSDGPWADGARAAPGRGARRGATRGRRGWLPATVARYSIATRRARGRARRSTHAGPTRANTGHAPGTAREDGATARGTHSATRNLVSR